MPKYLTILLLILLIGTNPCLANGYDGALALVSKKKYDEAKICFTNAVRTSFDSDCIAEFIRLTIVRDVAEKLISTEVFERCREAGEGEDNSANDQYNLATLYAFGLGVDKNDELANLYLGRASDRGHGWAHYALARFHYAGGPVSVDLAKSYHYFRLAAEQGIPAAQACLGRMYEKGIHVDPDPQKALDLYWEAAEKGDSYGMRSVSKLYGKGLRAEPPIEKLVQIYQQAADAGHAEAQNGLGEIYYYGLGVVQDYSVAYRYFKLAEEQDFPGTHAYLGEMHDEGHGVVQDPVLARRHFELGADVGCPRSQYALGCKYYYGSGVARDYATAAALFQKAARKNHISSLHFLFFQYEEGLGLPKDQAMATGYLRMAADAGDADAQYQVGLWYLRGQRGLEADLASANHYLYAAAHQGVAGAQFTLGRIYEQAALYEHLVEAHRWYGLAAQQGHENANRSRERLVFLDRGEDPCAICLEPFPASWGPILVLPCSHPFHERCVRQWAARSGGGCPICRVGFRLGS